MSDAFAPRDVTWTGVSSKLAMLRRGKVLTVIALAGLVLAGTLVAVHVPLGAAVTAAVAAALMVGAWSWIGRNQRAWGYTERADDLLVRRGVAFRQLLVVPYGRMQFVEVTDGPLQRRLGIATVQLHTAAAHTDARIPGLPAAEAARLRDRLTARGESRAAGL